MFFFLSLRNLIATEHSTTSVYVHEVGGAFSVFPALCALYADASGPTVHETTFGRFPLGEIVSSLEE